MKTAALLLAGALASAPIAAYDLSMTADERKSCDEQGGCVVVTRQWLLGRLQTAQAAGEQAAAQACRDRT